MPQTIELASRTVIGTVQNIQALYPASMLEGSRPSSLATSNHVKVKVNETSDPWDPSVNLYHFSGPEKETNTKMYLSVPNPLYREMKDYQHDLIGQGWVQRSNSSYASPVVCVEKKGW